MEQLIIFSKKYGVSGLLIVWLWWTNERLSKVEAELHKCYENSYNRNNSKYPLNAKSNYIAILPKKEEYVKEIIIRNS